MDANVVLEDETMDKWVRCAICKDARRSKLTIKLCKVFKSPVWPEHTVTVCVMCYPKMQLLNDRSSDEDDWKDI